MHVPLNIDGACAQVSSVGRSIGRGVMDTTQWNEMTRILSWKLGELYSGAVCEFEAIFPPMSDGGGGGGGGSGNYDDEAEDVAKQTSSLFPVLLRYDCDGSLLSDVELDFSGGTPTTTTPIVKRKFRVYHREV